MDDTFDYSLFDKLTDEEIEEFIVFSDKKIKRGRKQNQKLAEKLFIEALENETAITQPLRNLWASNYVELDDSVLYTRRDIEEMDDDDIEEFRQTLNDILEMEFIEQDDELRENLIQILNFKDLLEESEEESEEEMSEEDFAKMKSERVGK